jgi:hypothetical protein
MKDEIIVYQADEIPIRLEVRIENETVWLNIEQMVCYLAEIEQLLIATSIISLKKEN